MILFANHQQTKLFLNLVILFGVTLLLIVAGCGKTEKEIIKQNEAYSQYVSGYTSNAVSAQGEVVVRLASEFTPAQRTSSSLFQFEPSVSGSEHWLDERTVVFRPEEGFESETRYIATFRLGGLFDVPDDLKEFKFDFETIRQDMEVQFDGITPSAQGDRSRQQLSGTVHTADVVEPETIRRVLEARQNEEALPVEWDQETGKRIHHFTVLEIERTNQPEKVQVSWQGEPIGADVRGNKTITISSLEAFELVGTEVIRDANPHVALTFSDRLDPGQDFDGLIRIDNNDNLNIIVRENRLQVYPRGEIKGERTLYLSPGIRSREGKRLDQEVSRTILLHQPKPQVRFVGKGVIMPGSQELLLPFEAVSLGAVDVQVTRIFENNISQFLQDNNLNGKSRLSRVGRPIVQKVIPLSSLGTADVSTWNGYALDLSELIEPEPGAIYQVEMGFRKHQIVYPCDDASLSGMADRTWTQTDEEEEKYWNRFSNFYYPPGFNWQERDNPCHTSFYTRDRYISRNMLASDLGLAAKQGETGNLHMMVTDLKTARPKAGVDLELYDYQQQKLVTVTSDAQGMAEADTERNPFLLVAKDGDQRGYLKLNDGGSLSMSDFDVSGSRVEKGVKGFLYGDRGVWRPGDSLFVTLIVEDEQEVLPENHPVTFELRDPSGQVIDRHISNNPVGGFYSYQTKTSPDAPTGNWSLYARLGGNTFTKKLKIETVKPNRLKVDANLADERLTANDRILDGSISAQWLHGATAQNLKADISMTLSERSLSFDGYEEYTFVDPSRSLDAATEEIFDGSLDSRGNVDFSHTLNRMNRAPGALRASLMTRVFEESGNFSVNRSSIDYYPYPAMTGLRLPETKGRPMLDSDTTHTLDLVALDIDGNPVAGRDLEVEIYKVDWRWWWEKSNKNLSQYFTQRNVKPILSKWTTSGSDGKALVRFKIDEYDWGRFLARVKDSEGHSAGKAFYLGWSHFRNSDAGNPARLAFESDQEQYRVGEEVTLTIPSSAGGKALVSLESGSRIIEKFWVDTQQEQTRVSFLASRDMAPNIYAHVMLIQPHGQQQNDRPLRMYGIVPIPVEDPATKLKPVIDLPPEMRPETSVDIVIGEEDSRGMTYTVAMVDEGLLDLTNFNTPAPHDHFYAREALGVKTWDLYDHVASAYAGSMNRILSIGGDEDTEVQEESDQLNRFKPMVRYLGPFVLDEGTKNRHTIDIPNYVGSVRTMVVAGEEGAYGHAEKATPVRKPVMVLGTLPRVLGPDEEVTLPVSVFAMESGIEEVQVSIETNDIIEIADTPQRNVSFDEPGEEVIRFKLNVKSHIGAGRVSINARSGSETAHHDIDIEVRNPNPAVTNIYEEVLDPDEEWSFDFKPAGILGTNRGVFEVSRIPPVDLGRRLRYLIRYPHGCIEQVVSAVFPQLYLQHVVDLDDRRKEEIQNHVDEAIQRLQSFQVSSGGLGYWPDHNSANEWGTNYAYHFLLEAKSEGYYVPSDLLSNLNQYQQNRASSWRFVEERSRRDDLIQAYRLYTLSLANTPDLGAMNRLREQNELSVQGAWRLAAAYQLAGQPEAADELITGTTAANNISEYQRPGHTYGSRTRDQAMMLETLSIMDRREKAVPLMQEIAESLNGQRWMSTQTTAYSLIAIARFLEIAEGADEISLQYEISEIGQGAIKSTAPVSQVPFTIEEEGTHQLTVTNESDGVVFARLIQEGIPASGNTPAASNNLVQKVRYFTSEGTEVSATRLPQGTDIIAEVTVQNPGIRGNYRELALTQIFPSGWEIRNTRMDDISFEEPTSRPDYQDIRDDRVYTYFDLPVGKAKTFRIMLNASYTGRYYLPAVSTSAMYDEAVNARTPGQWVEVVLPE